MILTATVADIETAGLSQEEGHRIIEIALAVLRLKFNDQGQLQAWKQAGDTWCQRINPQRAIDKKAQQVHGISLAELQKEPLWSDIAPRIHRVLSASDLMIAHNANFDAPFIALELARAGLSVPSFDVFCTMQEGRSVTALGKVPSLGDLCWAMAVPYDADSAHAADYDVDCTVKAFIRGIKLGRFDLSRFQKEENESKSAA